MRNLKRVLSLTLATAMLFGMMVMGASAADKTAADLTDLDKVTNKAAVSLLVDLKIIEGKPDGSYSPTETVNRATMAKLITNIMMGDVDPSSFAGTTTDLKDVNGHWAEGYIKYCYANGYITGDGAGSFFPDQAVTAVQAAKMLLVALGYDSKDRGYEGDSNWSVNIMKDAQKMELLTNLEAKASDDLTRDNAALLIYNTLFAQTVECEYSRDINGNKYVAKVNVSTTEAKKLGRVTYGLTAVKGTLMATSTAALNGTVAAKDSVRVNSTTVKLAGNVDLLGQEVVYYTNASGKLISSSVVATGKSVVTTDTEGTLYSKFIKDNSLTATGSIYSDYTGLSTIPVVKPNAGDVVNYIDTTNDGTVDYIVRTVYEFGKVTKTTAESGSTKATVAVEGAGTYNSDEVQGPSDLAKNDLVLFAKVGNTLLVERPETIEGKISAYKGGNGAVTGITVDGTAYSVSDVAVKATGVTNGSGIKDTATASTLLKSEGTFYMDKGGKVVFMVVTTEGTANYAYLLSAKKTAAGFGSEGEDTYEAYVILSDGTKATYELTKASKFGKDNWDTDHGNDNAETHTTTGAENIYKYTINSDGKMTLSAPANNDDFNAGSVTHVKVEKNKAQFQTSTDDSTYTAFASAYMNKDTIFMFYDVAGDGKPVKVITGFENIPTSTKVQDDQISFVKNATTNVVEIVFLQTAAVTVSDKAYAYATGAAAVTTSDGTELEFVIDGAIKSLTVDAVPTGAAAYAIDTLYTYVTNDKGISTLTHVAAATVYGNDGEFVKNAVIKAVADNYVIVKIGNNAEKVVYLNDGYTVDSVLTTTDSVITKPSTGSLSVGDTISYTTVATGTNAGKLDKAYIVPTVELESVTISQSGNELSVTLKGARNVIDTETAYQWKLGSTNKATTATQTLASASDNGSWTVDVTVESRTGVTKTVTSAAFTAAYVAPPSP